MSTPQTAPKSWRQSPLWRLVAVLAILASFLYIGRMLLANWDALRAHQFTINWAFLAVAVAITPLTLSLGCFCWFRLLELLGEKPRYWIIFRISTYAALVRYLPGRVWNYIGKMYWGKKAGHSEKKILLSNVLDLMLQLISAAIVSVPAVSILFPKVHWIVPTLLALLMLFPAHPVVLTWVINTLGKRWLKTEVSFTFAFRQVLLLTCVYVLNWFIMGTQLFLFFRSFYPLEFKHIPAFSSFNASSWIVGYLSLITPAGLGIKESTFAFAFQTLVPASIAALAALLIRLFMVTMEVVVAGIFFLLDPGARTNFLAAARSIGKQDNSKQQSA